MRRQIKPLRDLLLKLEQTSLSLRVGTATDVEIYHGMLLLDADLAVGERLAYGPGPDSLMAVNLSRLTAAGHDLLDELRDENALALAIAFARRSTGDGDNLLIVRAWLKHERKFDVYRSVTGTDEA